MQKADGDQYFRIGNASRLISFVGLNEAVKFLGGQYVHEGEKPLSLAEEITKHLLQNVHRYAKKPETRTYPSMLPEATAAKRLAELDVEKYGWAKVCVQGTKEQPFYTDMVTTPLEVDIPWKERLNIEEKFHKITPGGHLAIVQLDDSEHDPESLLSATKNIVKTYEIGLYAYSRNLAYCNQCQKTFYGILSKCPICGSVNNMVCFSRMSAKYLPTSRWITAKRLILEKRKSYNLAAN
jgi:ribonucleoside-triphosphate reductase